MAELTGFFAGERIAEEAQQHDELFRQQMEQGNVTLKQQGVNLEASQIALDSQKKMIDLLSRSDIGSGSGEDKSSQSTETLPNALDQMSMMYVQSGLPAQAVDTANKAATLRSNQSAIEHRQLQDAIKHLTIAADLTQDVHDQASWEKANQQYELITGDKSPLKDKNGKLLDYSPELMDNLQNSIQTAKDKALTAAAQARARASEAEIKERQARIPLLEAQKNATEARDANLRKTGAKGPKPESLQAITDLITKDYAGAYLPEDARVIARPIAERATELIQTQGLSSSAAASRAYQEAKTRGDFGGARPRTPGSGTFNKPIPLPSEGGKIDKTKVRPNLWYNVNGTPMLYINGAFHTQQELEKAGEESETADDEDSQ
jgi:hypothetical protein